MLAKLLTPLNLGAVDLSHRVAIPGTGWDAAGRLLPPPGLTTLARMASPGGLVLSHPLPVDPRGQFHPACRGTADPERCRRIVAAIHAAGGRAIAQLAHAGRLAHPSVTGHAPLGADRIAASCLVRAADGRFVPAVPPAAMDQAAIEAVVAAYAASARAALAVGFDAVEISAAEGGLLDQFLHDGSNRRADAYGSAPEGRALLLLEVLDAVLAECDAARVGVRLSPYGRLHDMHDSDPAALFTAVLRGLNEREVAFVHLAGTGALPGAALYGPDAARTLRSAIAWPLIASGPFTPADGLAAVATRWADAVGFDAGQDGPALLEAIRAVAG